MEHGRKLSIGQLLKMKVVVVVLKFFHFPNFIKWANSNHLSIYQPRISWISHTSKGLATHKLDKEQSIKLGTPHFFYGIYSLIESEIKKKRKRKKEQPFLIW